MGPRVLMDPSLLPVLWVLPVPWVLPVLRDLVVPSDSSSAPSDPSGTSRQEARYQ
jgi:hypothetical protein